MCISLNGAVTNGCWNLAPLGSRDIVLIKCSCWLQSIKQITLMALIMVLHLHHQQHSVYSRQRLWSESNGGGHKITLLIFSLPFYGVWTDDSSRGPEQNIRSVLSFSSHLGLWFPGDPCFPSSSFQARCPGSVNGFTQARSLTCLLSVPEEP